MAQALDPNKAQVKGIQEYDSAVTNQMADKVVIYDADKSKISSSTLQDIKELYDKATIITQTGTSPNVRNDSTFVIVNNASEVRLTLNSAMVKGADGTDSSSLASGLLVTVFNASSRSHVVLYGNGNANSISLGANTTSQFYWTGSYWCLHSSVVDSLTVTGSASFGGTIGGSGITTLLSDYYNKQTVDKNYGKLYKKTVTGTTTTNGNINFDLSITQYQVICAIITNRTDICLPYRYNPLYWGGHCIRETSSSAILDSTDVVIDVYYTEKL